jgi:molybdopterin-containing oxidoreductase family iron-sulfur binding subunit
MTQDRWRSLSEAAGHVDPDAAREFPPGVDEPPDEGSLGRREALKLLGASVMLAGGAGCTRAPRGKIVPYGIQPPEVTPGVAQHYATAMSLDGYATGLIVESHEGRPTKIEGNPDHPASLGATGVREQASILSLYDPARAQGLLRRGLPQSWRKLTESLLDVRAANGGMDGLHLLLEPTSSPWIGALLGRLSARGARAHYYSPVSGAAAWEGTRLVFGRTLEPVLDLRNAEVVVSLDADFLASGPFHCRYARQFADGRKVRSAGDRMNRLYVVEPMLTVTGATADHRLRTKARDVTTIASALLREAIVGADPADGLRALLDPLRRWRESPDVSSWVRAVAKDLAIHKGRSLIVAGESQPAVVHAFAALLNVALGNVGQTVTYVVPAILGAGTDAHGLAPLLADLEAGRVKTLVIFGGNPSYTAPADLDFGRRIQRAETTAYLGAYDNETAKNCEWLIPLAHYLETWGDTRALDGTTSIVQPLNAPLFGGRTAGEILGVLSGRVDGPGYEGLVHHWKAERADFEAMWPAALQLGVVEGTAARPEAIRVDAAAVGGLLLTPPPASSGLELVTRADTKVHDGTFSNNAWLLELPDAMTKITWGNAALVSPLTARRLGLVTEDVVELSISNYKVWAPVFVMPGHADDSIALSLGYGREGDEELGRVGVNAYRLRTSTAPFFSDGLQVTNTGQKGLLATTQEHWSMEHRPIALEATLGQYRTSPAGISGKHDPKRTLYQLRPDAPNQWAMSIDLNACTGCNVCVVACQAENNVPVVGKEGVRKNREMHWIRLDRYFSGNENDPQVDVEPMACQHCEKAPCEYVCPVGATVHSHDGLNEMVYNRCVGTRFCSNNCPYKVRRFNWFDYNRDKSEPARMLMNPDVTVRARGVMEKCSYCVQRIRETGIHSRIAGTPIPDGGVKTACQQACPSNAIVFGSIGDPSSQVSTLHANERTYKVLDELGTEPRTRYMVRLRNPNPELSG